jgi:methyltransferase
MLIRIAVCGFAIVCRLIEMRASRRHISRYGEADEGTWSRRTFPAIVLLHTCVLGGTLLFGKRPRLPFLLSFIAVQPLRAWVLATLRERWNARGVVPSTMTVATSGPYAYVRHPNYSIVAVELFSLPAAFGLTKLGFIATAANAALLYPRIREEGELLMRLPGYEEHFGRLPLLVPFIV